MRPRLIPCLTIKGRGLVKTVKFSDPRYIGDPINAVKIFNEKEVDELVLLDIFATREESPPQFDLIEDIASECFMPFAYGGNLQSIDDMRRILAIGAEKIILNSAVASTPTLVSAAAELFGRQSVIVSVDVKRSLLGRYGVYSACGTKRHELAIIEYVRNAERLGAGEILLTSIDRDGTMSGYDTELIKVVSTAVSIPVVACGGAATISDAAKAIKAGAAAAAASSMFVYHGKHRAVLINYPSAEAIEAELGPLSRVV